MPSILEIPVNEEKLMTTNKTTLAVPKKEKCVSAHQLPNQIAVTCKSLACGGLFSCTKIILLGDVWWATKIL